MSNERIDLKQFEGHDEGPWEASEPSEVIYGAQTDKGNWPVLAFYPPRGKEKNGWWGDRIPAMHANLKLMAAGPELIAELKKLYEFMDLHQICGCGAICPNMNKETWARVKRCGFCESAE